MKKQKLFLYIVLVLLPFSAIAKTTKYVGIGTTRATLRTEKGESEWGRYVALGVEYFEPSAPLFGIEASYVTKKVILRNKTWPSSSELHHSGMSIGDVPIDVLFIELTAKIGCHIPIVLNQASIKLFTGSTISLQSRYLSRFRARIRLDYDPKKGPYKFDYLRCESEGISNKSVDLIIGTRIAYKAFGMEVRYARAFTEKKCLRGLTINDELDSFYILVFLTAVQNKLKS